MLNVGFIGFGSRASGFWKVNLAPFGLCTVKAIADPRLEEIKAVWGKELPDCTWYTNAEEMMEKEKLDGVFVGTRCNLHTKYALLVAKYDIPLFLEKPVSITDEEIAQLESIPHMDKKTVVSFPLRVAQLVTVVKDIIDRGVRDNRITIFFRDHDHIFITSLSKIFCKNKDALNITSGSCPFRIRVE